MLCTNIQWEKLLHFIETIPSTCHNYICKLKNFPRGKYGKKIFSIHKGEEKAHDDLSVWNTNAV